MIKTNKIIRMIVIVLTSLLFCISFILYKEYLNVVMKVSIMVIYLLFVFALYFEKKGLIIVLYFIFLFVILFVRDKVDTNISGNNYLENWLKLIFKNKIVTVNIIGNVILYMPFTWIILSFINKNEISKIVKYILGFSVSFIAILLLELLQFFTSLGVYDEIDILLNIIGVVIGIFMYEFFEVVNYGQRKEKEKSKKTRT